jgi:hypothetical protein
MSGFNPYNKICVAKVLYMCLMLQPEGQGHGLKVLASWDIGFLLSNFTLKDFFDDNETDVLWVGSVWLCMCGLSGWCKR